MAPHGDPRVNKKFHLANAQVLHPLRGRPVGQVW